MRQLGGLQLDQQAQTQVQLYGNGGVTATASWAWQLGVVKGISAEQTAAGEHGFERSLTGNLHFSNETI